MKQFITPKNIIIAIACIYMISVIERVVSSFDQSSSDKIKDAIIEYKNEEIELINRINDIKSKITKYENEINQNNIDIVGMDHDELDSLWAAYNS